MRHLVLGLVMAFLLVGATAAGGPTPGLAYIPDFGNTSTLPVNVLTGQVSTPITVGQAPFGVAVLPNGSQAYVTNSGWSGSVSVINTADNSVALSIPVGRMPLGVAASPDGRRVFVANFMSPTMSVIDRTTNSVLPGVLVGMFAWGVAVHPTLPYVYVTNMGNGSVTIVCTDVTNKVCKDLSVLVLNAPIGNGPFGVAVAPDGSQVYVALQTDGQLAILNPSSGSVLEKVSVGSKPTGVAVAPNGRHVYVTNNLDSGTLSVVTLDATTHAVIGAPTTVMVGSGPSGVAVSGDGNHVYVANSRGASLSVVNAGTNSVTNTIQLPAGSHPVAFGNFLVPGPTVIPVAIRVVPSVVNLKAQGNVPVMIYGADGSDPNFPAFDVYTIDLGTVKLNGRPIKMTNGPNSEPMANYGDFNGDGLDDVMVHISMDSAVDFQAGSPDCKATLTGQTNDPNHPILFRGCDNNAKFINP